MAEHGDPSRYAKHIRDGDDRFACIPCREAHLAQRRQQVRDRSPEQRAVKARQEREARQALTILRHRHEGEYLRILYDLRSSSEQEPE